MSLQSLQRHRLILAGLVVAWTVAPSHAQTPSVTSPPSAGTTKPATSDPAPKTSATPQPAPFWVAGVVITAAQRSAFLVLLDEARRDTGVVQLHQGESYGGYRLANIEPDRVMLERDGAVFPVVVGRPYAGPKGAQSPSPRRPIIMTNPEKRDVDIEAQDRAIHGSDETTITPGPPGDAQDAEARSVLERLINHPAFQRAMERRKSGMQGQPSGARPDGQGTPQASDQPAGAASR
jgi:hypothetical protein